MIVGVVVLYNPTAEIIGNVLSYASELDRIYAVDNSVETNNELVGRLREIENIEYLSIGKNIGIAAALNIGVQGAIREKATWVLTMDQDSRFKSSKDLIKLVSFLETSGIPNIGILSPGHNKKYSKFPVTAERVVMTSGNLVAVEAYLKVGGFEEKLFIDQVDYDFCLRLKRNGFSILRFNDVVLVHTLGSKRAKSIGPIVLTMNTHAPVRRYYITRNSLYLWKKYFRTDFLFVMQEIFMFSKNFLEIAIFSENRRADCGYMLRGLFDFVRNRFGALEQ